MKLWRKRRAPTRPPAELPDPGAYSRVQPGVRRRPTVPARDPLAERLQELGLGQPYDSTKRVR